MARTELALWPVAVRHQGPQQRITDAGTENPTLWNSAVYRQGNLLSHFLHFLFNCFSQPVQLSHGNVNFKFIPVF